MEGVAMQFCATYRAQCAAKVPIDTLQAVGGGTRSRLWMELIATLLATEIVIPQDGDIAACLGAARMAHAAIAPSEAHTILQRTPTPETRFEPQDKLAPILAERFERHRALDFRS